MMLTEYEKSQLGPVPKILALCKENERLRAENEKLREALKPFAADADDFDFMEDHDEVGVPVGDLRAAAAAIRESGE